MAFVPNENVFSFAKAELDPDKFVESKRVSDEFMINMIFGAFCECTPYTEVESRCKL
jgi:hypothetical protein